MTQKDPTSKAVVFSQFLGTLNVIGEEMTIRGVAFARVDGMMKQHHRADAINSFTTDPKTKVLLLSMRGKKKCSLVLRVVLVSTRVPNISLASFHTAGAAGLNLMAANYCFLMDPAPNSAVEEQAIDR